MVKMLEYPPTVVFFFFFVENFRNERLWSPAVALKFYVTCTVFKYFKLSLYFIQFFCLFFEGFRGGLCFILYFAPTTAICEGSVI